MTRKIRKQAFSLCWVLILAMPLLAQDPRGVILGRITDTSGAVIPGARVTATNLATNVSTSAVANEEGNYKLPYLLPGRYRLVAEWTGFKRYVSEGLELRVGDQLLLDLKLEVGEVAEQVVVTGETPLLETANASLGQVIDQRRIVELPLTGGNAFTLARFAAGVTNYAIPNHPTLATAPDVISRISVNGTGSNNSEFNIDGTPSMWGQNNAFIPPVDLVQEFKVQTAVYDASAGHSPGGNVNLVLRSGTNNLHGTLYHFHNNRSLEGIDFFQRQRLYDPLTGPPDNAKDRSVHPQHVINRYGGTMGGPVVLPKLYEGRNRTFWIYGFEGLIRPSTSEGSNLRTVPTLRQRGGDFSELLALGPQYQIYDPATIASAGSGRFSRLPFPGNIIPAARIDPVAKRLLNYWPGPNAAGTSDGQNNYFRRTPTRNVYNSHLARVDHNFSEKHRMFARYHQTDATFTSNQVFPNEATGTDRIRGNKGFGFDDVYVFSSSFLVNFRYGLSRYADRTNTHALGFDLAGAGFSKAVVAQLDPQGITFPHLAVVGLTALGSSSPSSSFTNYHTFALDLTKIRGNHSLRFGGEYRLFREGTYTFANQTPRIDFGSTWTNGPLDNSPAAPIGQGLASFLLGIPSGGQITVNPSFAEQSSYSAFYLQDDWKVTRKLTVNVGVRFEYETPVTERFNRTVRGFDISAENPIAAQARTSYAANPIPEVPVSAFQVIGGLTFAGVNGLPRELWKSDRNNIAPRIGLAYQLTKLTVIRAGYGIFFVPLGSDRTSVNQSGFTQRTSLVPSTNNGLTFLASLADPFPNGFARPIGAAGGLSTDVGRAISFFNEDVRNGYMQRWSLSVQQQLPQRVIAELSYVGNRGTALPVTTQFNPIPAQYLSTRDVRDQAVINNLSAQVRNPFFPLLPGTNLAGQTVARSQLLKAYPHFTDVSATLPVGFSWYHSLQTRVERRFANGFTLQGTYAWSKFMGATGYLNSSDSALEKVISSEDRPHRFTASGVFELPFGPGKFIWGSARGVTSHIVSGWQIQATYEGQSGPPIDFPNLFFNGNLHDIPLPNSERTVQRWFNTDAGFERNSTRQPQFNIRKLSSRFTGIEAKGLNIWNLSAIKNFRITEDVKLQFRSEWLNAFNHTHFAAPVTNPANTLFGSVTTSSGLPRQIHLALKLVF